ncbi:MAG: FKBP-type peptidyl-prolyl cis-trans isomerase, partial [Gammaproteobacteria bacterium]
WLAEDGQRGREIYNSRSEGRPVSFVVGTERVMPGWNEGVLGLQAGGRRLLVVPPALAYGKRRIDGVIPPESTLMFVIELLSVEPSGR